MTPTPHRLQRSDRQGGTILIVALFLIIVMVGIVVTGSSLLRSNKARTETSFLLTGQAAQFARAGIIEAVNWFRRQPLQPVLAFAPLLDTTADPKILDTEDADIGLMREFRIHGRIWGRYEVWKEWDADPDSERLAWRKQLEVEDVSAKRGRSTTGSVWRLRSAGYIYDRRDATKSFRSYPNSILATEILEAEISRLSIALPGQSALCASAGSNITISQNGRVLGGSEAAGIFYPQGSGSPDLQTGSEITGVPDNSPSVVYDDSIEYVFGVSIDQLRSMADQHLDDEADFPSPMPEASFIVLDGPSANISFGPSRKLDGTGLVVVRGDVTLNPGSSSFFAGLLYVDGKLTVHAPAQLRGAVIATGAINLQGVGDFADITYDENMLGLIQQTLASYRLSRSVRRVTQQE